MNRNQFQQAISIIRQTKLNKVASHEQFVSGLKNYENTSDSMVDFLSALYTTAENLESEGTPEDLFMADIIKKQHNILYNKWKEVESQIMELDQKMMAGLDADDNSDLPENLDF